MDKNIQFINISVYEILQIVPLCWYIPWVLIVESLYFPKSNKLILVATMFALHPVYNATRVDNQLRPDKLLLMQLYINILHS